MRNIFDQYTQPENKLTHALASALAHDRDLIRPFLQWIGIREVPTLGSLRVAEQQVPGELNHSETADSSGIPDMCVFNEDSWICLFEAKIQAKINTDQLTRHIKTAQRHDFPDPWMVVIAVDPPKKKLPKDVIFVQWRDMYTWFRRHTHTSFLARQLIEYMQVFESTMVLQDYEIQGTITMFDGLHFDEDNPYTYREAKRLIRLLGDELQTRKDLKKLGINPEGERRGSITGKGGDKVWDFLPLMDAEQAKNFTEFPHLSMGISSSLTNAAITIPNGVKGGFRSRLKKIGLDGFVEQLQLIYDRLLPVLEQTIDANPVVFALQRHYLSQKSGGITDARLDADLRTCIPGGNGGVKYQPQWIEAIYELLVNKKSNIQFVISVEFSYECPKIRSTEAVDLFAESWIAMSPIMGLVLD